jgi:hypothetical protein
MQAADQVDLLQQVLLDPLLHNLRRIRQNYTHPHLHLPIDVEIKYYSLYCTMYMNPQELLFFVSIGWARTNIA